MKVAIGRMSEGIYKVMNTKDLEKLILDLLCKNKTLVLSVDKGCDFYPDNLNVDLTITIADFYLG